MKKLSELKGEAALDILADILEPASEIMTDKEVAFLARGGENVKAVSKAIKNHKKAVIQILAAFEGEDPEKYEPPIMALPIKLLEILNDPDVQTVFSMQGQSTDESASGSATATTGETETA